MSIQELDTSKKDAHKIYVYCEKVRTFLKNKSYARISLADEK